MNFVSKKNTINSSIVGVTCFFILLLMYENYASASTKMIKACELIPIEKVDSIVGSEVNRPPEASGSENKKYKTWKTYCVYTVPVNKTRISFQLSNIVPVGKKTVEQWFDDFAKSMSGGEMNPVDNVGAKAFWIPSMKGLVVYKGDVLLTLNATRRGSSSEEMFPLCRQLGVEAMKKLP